MPHHPRRSRPAFHAAERRRARRRRGRAVTGRRAVLVGLVVLPAAAVALTALILVLVLAGALVLAGMTAVVVGAVAFAAVRRRYGLPRAPGAAPLAARPDAAWAHACDRFHRLAAAYAAHECDPMTVLRLPALSDVSVPSTGRFVDAFARAQALETDAYPGDAHAAAFVPAVDGAERAWRAAREAAERIRLSGLSPAERAAVERVIKLLTTARDSDHEAERLAAYARARTELAKLDAAGVIHLPRTAAAALDAAARGALPA